MQGQSLQVAPCPRCGAAPRVIHHDGCGWSVDCPMCGRVRQGHLTRAQAVAAWGRVTKSEKRVGK